MYAMKKNLLVLSAACALGASGEVLLPDPTIFRDGETYYLTGTEHGRVTEPGSVGGGYAFPVLQSTDLVNWRPADMGNPAGKALDRKTAFGTACFWAPQMFKYRDRYYYAYCANFRLAIAAADRLSDGFKAYADFPAKKGQIDPFVFVDDDGRAYVYCSNWDIGGLGGAILSDDLKKVEGEWTLCLRNDRPWEKIPLGARQLELNAKFGYKGHDAFQASTGVVEGPTVVKRNGKYVLFYSANDYRSPDYCVGAAVADAPLGPWRKVQDGPVLSREDTGLGGTGHGDVFFKPDGSMWYVFHAHNSAIRIHPRRTGMIRLVETVGADGVPRYSADRDTMTLF